MFLHLLRAVRVGQVAHVEGPPRRRQLQVGGIVGHVGRLLREQVVEVVAVARQVGEEGTPSRGQVAVQ
jgi:hypothetical protein